MTIKTYAARFHLKYTYKTCFFNRNLGNFTKKVLGHFRAVLRPIHSLSFVILRAVVLVIIIVNKKLYGAVVSIIGKKKLLPRPNQGQLPTHAHKNQSRTTRQLPRLRTTTSVSISAIMLFKATAVAAFVAAPSVSAVGVGCYPAWQQGGSYVTGSLVSATITVTTPSTTSAAATTTYIKKNFKCTTGSLINGSPWNTHCPVYDPSTISAEWSDQGECSGTAAIVTPSPTNKPTYAQWTGAGCPDAWVSGHDYEGNELAEVDGVVYRCSNALAVAQWCGGEQYKPGDSLYWEIAWTRLGSCDGTISPSKSPMYVSITNAGGCPDDYSDSEEYEEGDKVTVNGLVYKCRSWPNSGYCGRDGYEPGGTYSKEAWTLLGYCDGENRVEVELIILSGHGVV
jgi:hypothetical protein